MKKILLPIALSLFALPVLAQKTFRATINLDERIDPKKVVIHYQNGKRDVFMPDTLSQNTIQLRGKFYSQLLPVFINYDRGRTQQVFFIDDKPAKISVYLSDNNQLECRKAIAAEPVYDTSNKIYRLLHEERKKEWDKGLGHFLIENKGKFFQNDSLKQIYRNYLKGMNKVSINVLQKYPDSFFSSWYFRHSIVEPFFGLFSKDTAYIRQLIHTFKTIFPVKYTESIPGKTFLQKLNRQMNPIQIKEPAPLFSTMDLNGDRISLTDLKGKYVLLDFWATWCAPCVKEIPFIKKLRARFSKEKLVIIGISWDRNLDKLKEKIKKEKMDWVQIHDKNANIIHLYGVRVIPQLFLIDQNGDIIYKSTGYESENRKLMESLKHL